MTQEGKEREEEKEEKQEEEEKELGPEWCDMLKESQKKKTQGDEVGEEKQSNEDEETVKSRQQ